MSTIDEECEEKVEDDNDITSKKKLDQSTGIDLENHPVDVEKEILATVDATANNVPDVPLEEKNPPEIDDVQLEEDLEATLY